VFESRKLWFESNAKRLHQHQQPVQLEFIQVVHSLCDLLGATYEKLLALPAEVPLETYQNIHAIDLHFMVGCMHCVNCLYCLSLLIADC
jgi:hypothetical protein